MTPALTRRAFLTRTGGAAAASALLPAVSVRDWIARLQDRFQLPIGVCTSVQNAAVLKDAGCAYIEEGVRRLLIPDQPAGEFAPRRAEALACGLPVRACNGFLPGSLKSTGPEADHDGVLAFAATAFERAAEVGVRTIVFGSSGSRSIPEGFDRDAAKEQFLALLDRMGLLAARSGITVAIEPLQSSECNFINTVGEGVAIVRAVNHPHIRLLADIFHMLREEEGPGAIVEAGDLLVHLHIAEKARRTPPGTDGDSFVPYFRALSEIGYDGRLSIECGWDDLAAQLPRAVATLHEQMTEVGRFPVP